MLSLIMFFVCPPIGILMILNNISNSRTPKETYIPKKTQDNPYDKYWML